jgi:membrane protein implicated in regulation of membrane protease activity
VNRIAIALTVLVFGGVLALQRASGASGDSAVPSASASGNVSGPKNGTITGRVSSVDIKAGSFEVRSIDGKVVRVRGSKEVNPNRLRRGERVKVTYVDGFALTVQATRDEKSP